MSGEIYDLAPCPWSGRLPDPKGHELQVLDADLYDIASAARTYFVSCTCTVRGPLSPSRPLAVVQWNLLNG